MKTLRKARDKEGGQLSVQRDAATSAGNGILTFVLYVLRRGRASSPPASCSLQKSQLALSITAGSPVLPPVEDRSFTAARAGVRAAAGRSATITAAGLYTHRSGASPERKETAERMTMVTTPPAQSAYYETHKIHLKQRPEGAPSRDSIVDVTCVIQCVCCPIGKPHRSPPCLCVLVHWQKPCCVSAHVLITLTSPIVRFLTFASVALHSIT